MNYEKDKNTAILSPMRERRKKQYCPDIGRLSPNNDRNNRYSDTEYYLSRCGILYLEDKTTDINGEPFNYVKRELIRIFNSQEDNGSSIGTEDSPILLYINTYGGPVNDAIALYDQIMFMRKHYGLHIHTIAQGFALSGGAIILQAGTKRIASHNSIIMIHGVQSDYIGGTMKQTEIELESMKKMNGNIMKIWAKNMGVKQKDLEEELNNADRYFLASEALNAGLVDEVV